MGAPLAWRFKGGSEGVQETWGARFGPASCMGMAWHGMSSRRIFCTILQSRFLSFSSSFLFEFEFVFWS